MEVLPLKAAANIRDLGNYQTRDGAIVARHKVIRSAAIDSLEVVDTDYLTQYGVRTIVDFRSVDEREAKPDQKIQKAANVSLPIFSEEQTTVSAAPNQLFKNIQNGSSADEQMLAIYRHFVTDTYAKQQYRTYFELLLKNEEKQTSVLFHCTAGKDRTGFAAAILLGILGVPNEQIMEDYLATNIYLKPRTIKILATAQQAGASASMTKEIETLLSAKPAYLQASWDEMTLLYGGFDQFIVEGLGVNQSTIQDLKRLYLA